MERKHIDIESVISQRLFLQNVQRSILNKYNILSPTLNKFKTLNFLRQFSNWSSNLQDQFLIDLGGQAFLKISKRWINQLIKKETKDKEQTKTI